MISNTLDLTVDIFFQFLHCLLQLLVNLPLDPRNPLDHLEHFLLGSSHNAVLAVSVAVDKLDKDKGTTNTDTNKSEPVIDREKTIEDISVVFDTSI